MAFAWISEQTATYILYNIKCLVVVMEMENVYCAVRVEHLNSFRFVLKGLTFFSLLLRKTASGNISPINVYIFRCVRKIAKSDY
jgi:hypothetical protein